MEIIPRSDFILEKQKLIKPIEPVGETRMGNVPSKLREDKPTLSEKPKDPKRQNAELYQKI